MEKPRCKKCNSTQIRVRITTNEQICSTCGYIEKLQGGQNESKKNK